MVSWKLKPVFPREPLLLKCSRQNHVCCCDHVWIMVRRWIRNYQVILPRQIRTTFWHHGMPIIYPWANQHKRAHEKLADLEMESLGFPQWVIITYNNYFTYEKHGHVITCYNNLTFWRHQKQCLVREKTFPAFPSISGWWIAIIQFRYVGI